MPEDDAAASAPATPFDWYAEATRTALEQTLAAQQRAVDQWASAVEGRPPARDRPATPVRDLAWGYDVWAETLQNALVHLDDAVTDRGVDLDDLQLIWLHALDDAITDVGKTPEFAATITTAVERALSAQAWTRDASRVGVEATGLPTDRDVETVGARLLGLEHAQKAVEDALAETLDALDGTASREVRAGEDA